MIYISYPMYFDALNTIIEFTNRKNKNLSSFLPENVQYLANAGNE